MKHYRAIAFCVAFLALFTVLWVFSRLLDVTNHVPPPTPSVSSQPGSAATRTYRNPRYHYELTIPAGWGYAEIGQQTGFDPASQVLIAPRRLSSEERRDSAQFMLTVIESSFALEVANRKAIFRRLNAVVKETPKTVASFPALEFTRTDPYECPYELETLDVVYISCSGAVTFFSDGYLTYEFDGTVFGNGDRSAFKATYDSIISSFRLLLN